MRTTGFRSMVLYLLLAAFLGGLGYFLFNFAVNGDQWAHLKTTTRMLKNSYVLNHTSIPSLQWSFVNRIILE